MTLSRNDPCWCGSGQKWKKCHYPVLSAVKEQNHLRQTYLKKYGIYLKTEEQIAGIKEVCKITAKILEKLCASVKPGMSTQDLDDLSMKLHQEYKVKPAPLGYGYPPYSKSICVSLNEVICHGIPSKKTIIQEGDILNIDVSCILNGYYGDCSAMVCVGEVSADKKRVVDASYDGLMESIKILKPGISLAEVGNTITKIAHQRNCSVVTQFVGHGIGLKFHEEPEVRHYANNYHIPLEEGMTFTIEPMINLGSPEAIIDPVDKWTARTIDGKASAQWEHTVLITSSGYEILTLP
jgi:methionyl aminopeptidase